MAQVCPTVLNAKALGQVINKYTQAKDTNHVPVFLGNRNNISCGTWIRGTVKQNGGRRMSRRQPKLHSGGNSL